MWNAPCWTRRAHTVLLCGSVAVFTSRLIEPKLKHRTNVEAFLYEEHKRPPTPLPAIVSPTETAIRSRPKLEKWVGENFRSLVGSGSPFLKDVYGMAVDLKTAEFIPWTTLIERFVFDKDEPYFNIMVPTADTTR